MIWCYSTLKKKKKKKSGGIQLTTEIHGEDRKPGRKEDRPSAQDLIIPSDWIQDTAKL